MSRNYRLVSEPSLDESWLDDPESASGSQRRRVAPGKVTLTSGIPRAKASGTPAPVQARFEPATGAPPTADGVGGDDWTRVMVRPDLYSTPESAASSAAASGGLPTPLQARMEHAFGADLSTVRVGENPAVQSLGALAVAQGESIQFAPGQYRPDTPGGQELIGHELTHVLQQRAGRVASVQGKGGLIARDEALEREADILGARAARGESVRVPGASSSPRLDAAAQLMQIPGTDKDSADLSLPEIRQIDLKALNRAQLKALEKRCMALIDLPSSSDALFRAAHATMGQIQVAIAAIKTPGSDGDAMQIDSDDSKLLGKRERSEEGDSDEDGDSAIKSSKHEQGASPQGSEQAQFKVVAQKSGAAYANVASKITGTAPEQPEKRYPTAYIAQVPTHPGATPPAVIANNYEQDAFDNRDEANDRLRIAVGVNSYRDVAGNNRAAVEGIVNSAESQQARMGTFGFLWEPVWEKIKRGESTPMTASEVADDPDAKKLGGAYFTNKETHGTSGVTRQGKVPYGRIRDHIKNHPLTRQLTNELYTAHDNVFVHVGDDDAQALKAQPGKGVEVSGQDGEAGEALGLFSRYDAILDAEKGEQEDYALLASGGYEFQRKQDGGDIDNSSEKAEITLLANRLDRQIRAIMVQHMGPLSVYFPEPNTIYRVTEQNTSLKEDDEDINIFHDPDNTSTGGSAESQQMVANLLALDKDARAIYDQRAALITQTSGRFAEGEGAMQDALKDGTVSVALLKHIVSQNQSHASKQVWSDSVGQHVVHTQDDGKLTTSFIRKVFDAFIVTQGNFDRKSQAKLTAAQLQQFCETTLQATPSGQLDKPSPRDKKLMETENGQKLIAAAQECNKAIVVAIEATLALVTKKLGEGEPLTYKGNQ